MSGRGQGGKVIKGKTKTGRGGTQVSQPKKTKTDGAKLSLQDHVYYIGSSKQANDFVSVTKFLINHIRKTYTYGEDIGQALQSREPLDFSPLAPKLQVSKAEDEDTREIENEEFRVLHKAEVDSFVKRKDTYRSNAGNAYAINLWSMFEGHAIQVASQNRFRIQD